MIYVYLFRIHTHAMPNVHSQGSLLWNGVRTFMNHTHADLYLCLKFCYFHPFINFNPIHLNHTILLGWKGKKVFKRYLVYQRSEFDLEVLCIWWRRDHWSYEIKLFNSNHPSNKRVSFASWKLKGWRSNYHHHLKF